MYVAKLIEHHLSRHGWKTETILNKDTPQDFSHDYYFVLTPTDSTYARLPPNEKRISFQMEQTVSDRWFTEQYIDILRESRCVLDYSTANLPCLQNLGIQYPVVYHLPLGGLPSYADGCLASSREYDILFYGDYLKSSRRRRLLAALKERFNVLTVVDVYGQEMKEMIKAARIVINLHFYEGMGMLESTRIYECLSLGTAVVSESPLDRAEYPELEGVVRYFEPESIDEMLAVVQDSLACPVASEDIEKAVRISAKRFSFMFDRMLIAENFLSEKSAYDLEIVEPNSSEIVAVSMPETVDRRRDLMKDMVDFPFPFRVFDGIRRRPGPIGCGLSHSVLAHRALAKGLKRLTIMEDDVVFPHDFSRKWPSVVRFLDLRSGEWDIFAGVVAELRQNTSVLWAVEFEGLIYAAIDEMVSTVFNVYSDRGLRILASWKSETAEGIMANIDQHIRRQERLRVVVTYPYLVEHRKEALSTIETTHNDVYWKMIAKSQETLRQKICDAIVSPLTAAVSRP